jgi:probable F420-dependent oxidoreductase
MSESVRPIRFGCVMSLRGGAREWAESAREVEASGYDVLLVPDTVWTPAPFQVLAAAAATTTTLRLGTWVLSAPLRRPQDAAREARTLQELAQGRFELGIGAGRPGGEKDAATLGVDWGTPRERVDRVEQTIAAVRDGSDAPPPIVIAGQGNRMLGIAARTASTLALPVSPAITHDELKEVVDRVRAVTGPDLELALQITGVGDELPDWLRHQMGLTPEELRRAGAVAMLSGDDARDADTLLTLRAETGISYFTIAGQFSARLAPLVALAAGR